MLKIGEKYEFIIQDMGMNFEGIAKSDEGLTVFIKNAIIGERVIAKVEKITKTYAMASLQKIIQKSANRIKPVCMYYNECGGCDCQHIDYDKTLDIKLEKVKNAIRKQGLDPNLVKDITGMAIPYYYRNKVQYPVRSINGKNLIGMFSKSTHDIVQNKECFIQDKITHEVAHKLFKLINKYKLLGYNEKTLKGDIKNIIVRRGIHTSDIMCVLVVTDEKLKCDKRILSIVEEITKIYSNIKSFMLNVNSKNTNVILSDKNICMYKDEYITDYIGDFKFNISANSFFQVNTLSAEVLYNVLKEELNAKKDKTLLELYSGVGSIGIFLSDCAKEIYSVEIVESAVKAAIENAKLNGIDNIKYINGDATLETLKLKKEGKFFDYIVVDPPRKGLDKEGIDLILTLAPEKIGYVSYNPATLARDLKLLEEKYKVETIRLVDMFPWTGHVESVAVLCLK